MKVTTIQLQECKCKGCLKGVSRVKLTMGVIYLRIVWIMISLDADRHDFELNIIVSMLERKSWIGFGSKCENLEQASPEREYNEFVPLNGTYEVDGALNIYYILRMLGGKENKILNISGTYISNV